MRIFETLIVLLNLPVIVFSMTHLPRPVWVNVSMGLAVTAVLVHLFFEGWRWQMIPAYVVCCGLGLYCLTGIDIHGRMSEIVGIVAGTMLLGSVLLGTALPVFSLPTPDGPHAIGTVVRHWERNAVDGSGQLSRRALRVQFWYPTEVQNGERSLYRTDDAAGIKSHLRLVKTHSIVGAPVGTTGRLPVILYSPGWKGHLTQNTVQFEMLASHGYVVLAVLHPPDNDVPEDFDPSLESNLREYSVEVKRRAEDMIFLADELAELNQRDPGGLFTGRLDNSRLGMMGFSFGGAVAAESCWLDARFKAGMNMDGLLFGEVADAGVEQPFFFMSDDATPPSPETVQANRRLQLYLQTLEKDGKRVARSMERHGGYYLSIRGQAHSNFSDQALFSPFRRLTDAGTVDAQRSMRILNEYTLAFFEQSLNGKSQLLLKRQPSLYQDVRYFHQGSPAAGSTEAKLGSLSRMARPRP